jgi:Ni,Fe-hydrogenase I cytochrome b subunit
MIKIIVASIGLMTGLTTAILGVCFIAESTQAMLGVILLIVGMIVTGLSIYGISAGMKSFEHEILRDWAQARFVGQDLSDD